MDAEKGSLGEDGNQEPRLLLVVHAPLRECHLSSAVSGIFLLSETSSLLRPRTGASFLGSS